jgi:CBS domain-containing protein
MNSEVTVRELMNREYVGVSESDDLVDTVELLLREDADTAVVLRGSDPVGVVTERDILALLVDQPSLDGATVADAMTESLPTVSPDQTLDEAADRMSARSARRLVVMDRGEPLGVITEHDLLAGRVVEPAREATIEATMPGESTGSAMATEEEPTDNYEDQSICEVCGSFSSDLSSFNGQLVCADCRDI